MVFSVRSTLRSLRCLVPVAVTAVLLADIQTASSSSNPLVTCGSSLKLLHQGHDVRLHSHEVHYGSGSGQQSVTGVKSSDDVNSYWLVRGHMEKPCTRGEPIECGSVVRLQHVQTKHNLHSHLFPSPMSRGHQEVSCFGKGDKGDSGDHWMVTCPDKHWRKTTTVQFKHVDTAKYLHVSGSVFQRPIQGQFEISAAAQSAGNLDWSAKEGVFLHPTQKTLS